MLCCKVTAPKYFKENFSEIVLRVTRSIKYFFPSLEITDTRSREGRTSLTQHMQQKDISRACKNFNDTYFIVHSKVQVRRDPGDHPVEPGKQGLRQVTQGPAKLGLQDFQRENVDLSGEHMVIFFFSLYPANLPWSNLCPLPLVLSLHILEKWVPLFLTSATSYSWRAVIRTPLVLLFPPEQTQFLQPKGLSNIQLPHWPTADPLSFSSFPSWIKQQEDHSGTQQALSGEEPPQLRALSLLPTLLLRQAGFALPVARAHGWLRLSSLPSRTLRTLSSRPTLQPLRPQPLVLLRLLGFRYRF